MGHDLKPHSSKHKRSREKDSDRKSKKRHKNEDHEDSSSRKGKRNDKDRDKLHITDDDPDDDDMWVEKNIDMDGERVSVLHCYFFVFGEAYLHVTVRYSLWQRIFLRPRA
jgi:hypothetical protein